MSTILSLPVELHIIILDLIWSRSDPRLLIPVASCHRSFFRAYLASKRRYQIDFLSIHLNSALCFAKWQPILEKPPTTEQLQQDPLTRRVAKWQEMVKPLPCITQQTSTGLIVRTPRLVATGELDDKELEQTATIHRNILELFRSLPPFRWDPSLDKRWKRFGGNRQQWRESEENLLCCFYLAFSRADRISLSWNWIADLWKQRTLLDSKASPEDDLATSLVAVEKPRRKSLRWRFDADVQDGLLLVLREEGLTDHLIVDRIWRSLNDTISRYLRKVYVVVSTRLGRQDWNSLDDWTVGQVVRNVASQVSRHTDPATLHKLLCLPKSNLESVVAFWTIFSFLQEIEWPRKGQLGREGEVVWLEDLGPFFRELCETLSEVEIMDLEQVGTL